MKRFADIYAKLGKPRLSNPFKREVNIVYHSAWLSGRYVFRMKAGEVGALDRWKDEIINLMSPEPTAEEIACVRREPMLTIVEIF